MLGDEAFVELWRWRRAAPLPSPATLAAPLYDGPAQPGGLRDPWPSAQRRAQARQSQLLKGGVPSLSSTEDFGPPPRRPAGCLARAWQPDDVTEFWPGAEPCPALHVRTAKGWQAVAR